MYKKIGKMQIMNTKKAHLQKMEEDKKKIKMKIIEIKIFKEKKQVRVKNLKDKESIQNIFKFM